MSLVNIQKSIKSPLVQTLKKNIEHDVIIGESNKLTFDHLFTGMKH